MTLNSLPEVDLVIPMIPNIELAATKTAVALAEFMNFDEDKIDEVRLALIEACINAFEHSKSEDRKLYFKFIIDENSLTVIIKDNGKGFDVSLINDKPNINDKLKSNYKRGWGIMLIKNLMDSVKIESNNNGTILTMTKLK
ncbi:MAG: histidine kinase [Candidatus Sericytochromatia bacterium]|nr:MAG: histidine kinase [Candidatus Sericytochromatia bacterium]